MAKKLLDRFENSPKVWAIVYEREEDGSYSLNKVKKVYNSIADAHRDNPKISCSHIEDYCNATFFTKCKHMFAYEGYYIPFTIDEVLSGKIYSEVITDKKVLEENEREWVLYEQYKYLLSELHSGFWNYLADKLIADIVKDKARYNYSTVANEKILEILSKSQQDYNSAFLYGLYKCGWHSSWIFEQAKIWLGQNTSREMFHKMGAEPVVPNQKPYSIWTQTYKQQNYF